ncbi:MAG: hypothetical protein JW770_06550 [Actinobacteria bacterium]|nr:hypothetical protein [Actinomycetota bacterium]
MKNVVLYNYPADKVDLNIGYSDIEDPDLMKIVLSCSSPYPTGISKNDTVHAEIFLKKTMVEKNTLKKLAGGQLLPYVPGKTGKVLNDPARLIILIHGFSTRSKRINNYYYFAESMARHGIPCIFVNLPLHLNRTPEKEKSGDRLIYFDDVETLEFFHQSVVDIRKLLNILFMIASPLKIYICGISLGSMVSVVTMANEERIDKGIFLIGGGIWEEIHWKGVLKYVLKGNCTKKDATTWQDCHEIYSNFPRFLEIFKKIKNSSNLTFDMKNFPELKKAVTKFCFLCDPVAFAHRIDPARVLMINSKMDFYFTKRSTSSLWEALSRPRIVWLNSLHTSKILTSSSVINEIFGFIND